MTTMSKKLWGTLHLGGIDVPVYVVDSTLLDEWGNYHRSGIQISDDATGKLFWSTLCREMVHAISEHYGLKSFLKDEEDEEKLASILGTGFHQMIQPFVKEELGYGTKTEQTADEEPTGPTPSQR